MVLWRLRVEGFLLAILALHCSAALCANHSGAIFTSTHAGLQVIMEFVVRARVFNTSVIPMATEKRT